MAVSVSRPRPLEPEKEVVKRRLERKEEEEASESVASAAAEKAKAKCGGEWEGEQKAVVGGMEKGKARTRTPEQRRPKEAGNGRTRSPSPASAQRRQGVEEEEDGGALPELNEEQANQKDGSPAVHLFDLNLEAIEEQEQMHSDDDDALQYELEALEDDLQDYGVYIVSIVFDVEELLDSDEENDDANANEPNKSRELTNIER
ncbi:hypothetical protein E2562_018880 [Oryza meyeriana var. granulata]|uniref:Uncharacterized protein n=1 Tax=Oryza meyeriana var. granulata TaxID=110450 RepID=A0A6G1F9Q4_9ORYZ|nr:hypothetical protein E2562_018880 [Oryza meyeriana var. granulata]